MRNQIYFWILLLLFSCKEENSKKWTEVNVSVKNYWTNEPINDVVCAVIASNLMGTEILNQSSTENGSYQYGFKANKNQSYSLISSVDLMEYHNVSFFSNITLDKGNSNGYVFTLLPIANFIFHFENQNCFDATDSMWFKTDHTLIEYQSEDWNPLPRTGCYYLHTSEYPFPVGPYVFTMKIKRDGIITYLTKEVILQEDSTTVVELFY